MGLYKRELTLLWFIDKFEGVQIPPSKLDSTFLFYFLKFFFVEIKPQYRICMCETIDMIQTNNPHQRDFQRLFMVWVGGWEYIV